MMIMLVDLTPGLAPPTASRFRDLIVGASAPMTGALVAATDRCVRSARWILHHAVGQGMFSSHCSFRFAVSPRGSGSKL